MSYPLASNTAEFDIVLHFISRQNIDFTLIPALHFKTYLCWNRKKWSFDFTLTKAKAKASLFAKLFSLCDSIFSTFFDI
jgi:hypothetical protein